MDPDVSVELTTDRQEEGNASDLSPAFWEHDCNQVCFNRHTRRTNGWLIESDIGPFLYVSL